MDLVFTRERYGKYEKHSQYTHIYVYINIHYTIHSVMANANQIVYFLFSLKFQIKLAKIIYCISRENKAAVNNETKIKLN